MLQEAVKFRPSYADAYTGMGVSFKELGRKNDAVTCLQQVVRLRPTCALSLGNLAGTPFPPNLAIGIFSLLPGTTWGLFDKAKECYVVDEI